MRLSCAWYYQNEIRCPTIEENNVFFYQKVLLTSSKILSIFISATSWNRAKKLAVLKWLRKVCDDHRAFCFLGCWKTQIHHYVVKYRNWLMLVCCSSHAAKRSSKLLEICFVLFGIAKILWNLIDFKIYLDIKENVSEAYLGPCKLSMINFFCKNSGRLILVQRQQHKYLNNLN